MLAADLRPERGVRRERVLELSGGRHPPDLHRLHQHLQQKRDIAGPVPECHVSSGRGATWRRSQPRRVLAAVASAVPELPADSYSAVEVRGTPIAEMSFAGFA